VLLTKCRARVVLSTHPRSAECPAAEPQAFDVPVFHRWLIELRDARSKPSSAGRHTDKEHGAAALGRWRRHQHIVNPEVAVGRQRDTRMLVLNWVKGGVASQISVAKTLALPFVPMVLPPPSSRPRPSTRIRPSTFTSALKSEITQI
jgi:hypothetical protein